jgi:peptide/nickel transport system substrate-binding protein
MATTQTLKFVYERGNLLAPAPHRTGDLGREWTQLLHMTLLVNDIKNNVGPGLAKSWSANADSSVYTFSLDPRAVWSDGSPVTAKDVKDCWEWNADPGTLNTQVNNVLYTVKGFTEIVAGTKVSLPGLVVKDNLTLEVQLTQSDPLFPYRAALHWASVVRVSEFPKPAAGTTVPAAADLNAYFNAKHSVNGPYQIDLWDPNKNEYNLVLNPKWWGAKPLIERLELRSILDPQTLIVAMQNKEYDAAYVQGVDSIAQFYKLNFDKSVKPIKLLVFWYWFVGRDLTDDVWLRRALQHAIDMKQIVQVASLGAFKAWDSLIGPDLQCYDPKVTESYFKYDVALAKQELAKSKYGPTGDKVPKIRMAATGMSDVMRAAQIMAEQWRQNLGITDVEISTATLPPDEAAKLQIGRLSQTAYLGDPINLLMNLGWSKGYQAVTMGGGKAPYKNEAFDKALESAALMSRTDPKFCEAVNNAMKIFADDSMIFPYVAQDRVWFLQPWVKNVFMNSSESPYSMFTAPLMYIAKH